jgi:hypothetical protein
MKSVILALLAFSMGLVAVIGVARAQVLLTTLIDPGAQAGDRFGFPLATGDVNLDGKADVAVGAPGANGQTGRVYVLSSAGQALLTLNPPQPQATAEFAMTLAMGDVNGDGRADIAVGAQEQDYEGRVYVFSGANGSLL